MEITALHSLQWTNYKLIKIIINNIYVIFLSPFLIEYIQREYLQMNIKFITLYILLQTLKNATWTLHNETFNNQYNRTLIQHLLN